MMLNFSGVRHSDPDRRALLDHTFDPTQEFPDDDRSGVGPNARIHRMGCCERLAAALRALLCCHAARREQGGGESGEAWPEAALPEAATEGVAVDAAAQRKSNAPTASGTREEIDVGRVQRALSMPPRAPVNAARAYFSRHSRPWQDPNCQATEVSRDLDDMHRPTPPSTGLVPEIVQMIPHGAITAATDRRHSRQMCELGSPR